jgi:hypothetical protein
MTTNGISGRGYPMLRRLRLVVGLTLLLTVIAGSFEPALASPLSQARPARAFADTVWRQALGWWNGVIAPGSKVATNSGYGTDSPILSLPPTPATTSNDNGSGVDPFGGK